MTALSCAPNTTTCLAVGSGGTTFTFAGSTFGRANVRGGGNLIAVSCAAATLCIAIDGQHALTINGPHTSSIDLPDQDAKGITCGTDGYCLTTSDGNGIDSAFIGGHWQLRQLPSDSFGKYLPGATVCLSRAFCAALDYGRGHFGIANNDVWKLLDRNVATNLSDPSALSCATPTFCVIIDSHGNAFQWRGGPVSGAQDVANGVPLEAVSCPTPTFCMALDDSGGAYTFDGTQWSSRTEIGAPSDKAPTRLSCASSALCVAIDNADDYYVYRG